VKRVYAALLLLLFEQAGECEQVEKEINISLQGIGLSLVNNKQRKEIAYMAISRLVGSHQPCDNTVSFG